MAKSKKVSVGSTESQIETFTEKINNINRIWVMINHPRTFQIPKIPILTKIRQIELLTIPPQIKIQIKVN